MQLLSRLMLGIACAVGAANAGFAADAGSADARLKAIYSTEWKWRERQLPDAEDTQKPIQDHLPKVDPASQAQRLAYWQDVLKKLDAIPRAQLSPVEQVNYDIYHPEIEGLISNWKFRDFEMPANADTTFWTDLGYTARRQARGRYRGPFARMDTRSSHYVLA